MDLINMMILTKKIQNISIEFATTLIGKARDLVGSNYMVGMFREFKIHVSYFTLLFPHFLLFQFF